MNIPEYWKGLTPRQQLNDAVHKYAQATGREYREAWFRLERLYFQRYGVDLTTERKRYEKKNGVRPTIPLWFEMNDLMEKAIALALELRNDRC